MLFARTGDQFEDWPLRTTLWNLLRKFWKSLCILFEIPSVSSLYSNPSCQTLKKAFEITKKLALTSSEETWSKSTYKYYGQLTAIDFRVIWSKTRLPPFLWIRTMFVYFHRFGNVPYWIQFLNISDKGFVNSTPPHHNLIEVSSWSWALLILSDFIIFRTSSSLKLIVESYFLFCKYLWMVKYYHLLNY